MSAAPDLLQLLQLLTFKGPTDAGVLATATGRTEAELSAQLQQLTAEGLAALGDRGYAIASRGAARREELVAEERDALPAGALPTLYERFGSFNARLKSVVTAWQLRPGPDGEPVINDHADDTYDDRVRDRLAKVDEAFRPLLEDFVALVPRWTIYPARFDAAMASVDGGDDRYFASPLLDSYHTIWFELHEELFGAHGLNRAAEEVA